MQRLVFQTETLVQQGTNFVTKDGLIIHEDDVRNIMKFNKLPETLMAVDQKYGLNTSLQLVQNQVKEVSLLVDEADGKTETQVLDPKSKFLDDEQYAKIIEVATNVLEMKPTEEKRSGFQRKTSFKISADTDIFMSDAYNKAFEITRLPQGGLHFSVGLLRLACTNGAVAHDKELHHLMRLGRVDESIVLAFGNKVRELNLDQYLRSLFMNKGEYFQASVADYLAMRDCLEKLTDKEYAELLYPMEQITQFYADQDINIESISRQNLHRLPSGIRYYEAFNILTNGAKQAEPTIANQIEVARFSSVARLKQLRDSDITFHGAPHFDPASIARRMGDHLSQ